MTEDLPTPPFPEAIPNTLVKESGCANGMNFSRPPLIIFFTLFLCSSLITPKLISTDLISEISLSALVISDFKRSFIGQPTMVSKIAMLAVPLANLTASTIPSSGSGLCNSGSMTFSSALLIESTVLIESLDLFLALVLPLNQTYQ